MLTFESKNCQCLNFIESLYSQMCLVVSQASLKLNFFLPYGLRIFGNVQSFPKYHEFVLESFFLLNLRWRNIKILMNILIRPFKTSVWFYINIVINCY